MTACIVPSCERPRRGLKDMCRLHIERTRRGLPLDMPLSSRPDTFDQKWSTDANGCHRWSGATSDTGYGNYRGDLAHRVAFERANGPIPAGLHIDHLCRVRNCVNPAHLEAVTQRENNLRSEGASAINAQKTSCPRGHEFTPENTHIRPDTGGRVCRTCSRDREVKRWRDRRDLATERDREWWADA